MTAPQPEPRINAVALGVILQDNHLLLEPMARWLNVGLMWRPIGGFIEFSELSEDAVVREFKEELNRDVEVVRLLEVTEHLFEFAPDSGPLHGHEVTFLYELRFAPHHEPVDLEPIESFEHDAPASAEHSTAHWLPVSELLAGQHPVYPADLMTKLAPVFE
ncbi:MAG: NUDIX domain-containing protein [Dehalococcoidia bacterium]|jgi:ADP-ribose pyrophosphatase YjhB (NUDIX family)|nr:NUDIX domain-containing protein [Dehalococcoidia bacterium]